MTMTAVLNDTARAEPLAKAQAARGEAPIAVEVQDVSYVYRAGGRTHAANQQIDLRIRRGEVFGLLGPNGAGKTTLVRQMIGLLAPTSGSIRVDGIDVQRHPDAVKRKVGFLPQSGVAMRLLEVDRALYFTGCLRGQSEGDARRQAAQLLLELNLTPFAKRYVNRLSGGQVRIVNFAMTLMGNPSLLILDEPTNELDPSNRRLIWDHISRLSRTQSVTIVLVTHNVVEAERVMDRVAIMNRGSIVRLGTPGELKQSLDGRVKLEWRMRRDERLSPGESALLDGLGTVASTDRELYQVYSEPPAVKRAVGLILEQVGLARIEDFRLAPPSLEDVYLGVDMDAPLAPLEGGRPSARHIGATSAPRHEPRARSASEQTSDFLNSLRYLVLEQALALRTTWIWSAVFSFLMPLAMVFGLSRIGSGLTDRASLIYIVSGSAVFAVTTEGLLMIAQRIGLMRENGTLVYYASLPISKVAFIVALVSARLGLILPGLITPIAAGLLLYDLKLDISPWVLLVLPVTSLSLSGVGMAIGLCASSLELIMVISNLTLFVVLLGAPVMIPETALPIALQALGRLMPPSYAADALRRALLGDVGLEFVIDMAVLLAITAGSLHLISRRLRWRA